MNSKILLSSILLSSVLFAEIPKAYIDMNYVLLNYSDNGTTSDFKPTGFKLAGGYILKDFNFVSFAVEGSLMLGVDNDSKSNVTLSNENTLTNAEASLDKMYNLQIKTIVPIVDNLNANVYLGGSRVKILTSANNFTGSNSWSNSVSYGTGLKYWFPSNVSLRLDYMKYFKNIEAVEIGLGFRF